MSRRHGCCERHDEQNGRHRGEGRRIRWRDAKELRAEEPGQEKSTNKAAGESGRGERGCLANDQGDKIR